MANTGKIYDDLFKKYKKEGLSEDAAHIKAAEEANKAAVKIVGEKINKPKMSKAESDVKAFSVRAKMEAKLKVAEEDKARREKLGKMSIEELKELKVKKG